MGTRLRANTTSSRVSIYRGAYQCAVCRKPKTPIPKSASSREVAYGAGIQLPSNKRSGARLIYIAHMAASTDLNLNLNRGARSKSRTRAMSSRLRSSVRRFRFSFVFVGLELELKQNKNN